MEGKDRKPEMLHCGETGKLQENRSKESSILSSCILYSLPDTSQVIPDPGVIYVKGTTNKAEESKTASRLAGLI